MAQDIATNPDFNQFDGEDYTDLTFAGASEGGRTLASNIDFFLAVIIFSVVLSLTIGLLVWGFIRRKK